METVYTPAAPERSSIEALSGAVVLEFGTNWCGHCLATQAPLAQAMVAQPQLRHYKIEDGPGRALGRSYRVKLWPTLIFLRDGVEVTRLVRPLQADDIAVALAQIVD
ncbi:thioredoxin family protein [Duganella fentianensis]|uniref:thioredoxin family protein n=1 Tax=Duganella fentianensis TaxID=2692177 RepID=UPI0032B1C780